MKAQKIFETLQSYNQINTNKDINIIYLREYFDLSKRSYELDLVFYIFKQSNPEMGSMVKKLFGIIARKMIYRYSRGKFFYSEILLDFTIKDLANFNNFGQKTLDILILIIDDLVKNPEKYKDAELITRQQAKIDYQ